MSYINWDYLKDKCPECGSTSIEKLNEFKMTRIYRHGVYGKKRVEVRKLRCKSCGNEWWDD